MSEPQETKPISETDAVVETEHGTRYRALRSGKAGKPRSERASPLRWLRNVLAR